jgi:gluconolactonase
MKLDLGSWLVIAALALFPIGPSIAAEGASETAAPGRIVRLGTRLDGIVAADAELEKLADGYTWLEGPVWLRREGALLFSVNGRGHR